MSSVTRQAGLGRRACSLTLLVLTGAVLVVSLGCTTGRVFQQGNTAARTGDWDLAVSYYKKAAERAPGRSDYLISLERAMLAASREHLARAHDYEEQDQLDFALREYRKVIEYDGANQEARTKVQRLEQTIRDRIEASRPRPAIEQLRDKARQVGPEPTLNPASRDPLFIKFSNQQLRDILNFVGAATGINVTYDAGFQDKAYSVELSGVTLEQALQQILTANLLFFKVLNERSIIVVPESPAKRQAYEEQAIQTFFLSHADPTEMLALLNLVLRPQQAIQSVFAANKSNNTITVRATVPMLQIAERVIQTNDRPRAEIVVDVEILEVNRTRAKQYGLDLSEYALGVVFSPESKPGGTTGGTGATTSSTSSLFNVNTVSAGISAADFYGAVPSAVIKFLETDSETKFLAKPQLRGSEGEKLTLNLGTEVPVPSTTFTPMAGGGTAFNPLTSFTYKTVGVNVEIEPRATYEGDIIMKLSVEVSSLAGDTNIGGQNLPSFGTRKVTTRLRLRDGESNLLAGLIQEREKKSLKGFPGLIHVPILKQLFSYNDNSTDQTDIVMLLTPHIVRTHELTQRDVGRIYIGTQQNLGLTGPPPLIGSPTGDAEAEVTAPLAGAPVPAAVPRTNPPALVPGTPVPAPPGSGTVPVVPPGSSPIPGTVGVPVGAPAAPPAVPPAAPVPAAVPRTNPPALVPGTPVPAPPGSGTVPVVPPGSSLIPGTVSVPTGAPAAPPAAPPAQAVPSRPTVPPPGIPAVPAAPPQGAGLTPTPSVPAPAPARAPAVGTPVAAPSPALVTVSMPGPELMVAGGPYTVPIAVSGANRLSTVTLKLAYNPRTVRVRLVQEGSFMRQGGVTVTFAQQVDAAAGRVDITIARTSDSVGAMGSGMLAAVVFDAIGTGTSPLTLSGVATAPGGLALPLQFQPTNVTVR